MSYVKNSQGIVINNDDSHYKAILAQRDTQRQSQTLCVEIDNLKDELMEIKKLLAQVINRN
tara:strand:+ start:815 stop:997 length:183 start_codon:yes stop_codon:yes gene_type:complete